MARRKFTPWDGSQRILYRCVAKAVGCNPNTVQKWHYGQGIKPNLLAFLEDDNSARYASRRGRSPANSTSTPNPPAP